MTTPQKELHKIYPLVDSIIKQGLTSDKLNSLIQASKNVSEATGALFDLPAAQQYILKRFILACMSTDSQIRYQAFRGFKKWQQKAEIKPNAQKVLKFLKDASNYKKGGYRKSQMQALAEGRILVVKALSTLFKNNTEAFQSLTQVLADFEHLEPQVIEACHSISYDKVLKLKFHSFSPKTKSSRFLYKILLNTKQNKYEQGSFQDINEIVQMQAKNYPKQSTVLYNIGKYLHLSIDNQAQFFRQFANKFLDNDSELEVNIHQIHAVLTILKGYLEFTKITKQDYKKLFDKKIISVWLQQFRVLNKKMKSMAKSITIQFEQNADLAYQALVDLHQQGVYLDNISSNHPFSKLYSLVDVEKYWKYVYSLCENNEKEIIEKENTQAQEEEQEQIESQTFTFYNELEYFIKLRFKQLPDEHLCQTIVLLLNRFHRNQKQKQPLYLCMALLNLVCKTKKGKKQSHNSTSIKLNKKCLLVLNKINFDSIKKLSLQQKNSFKKSINWIKKATINIRKDENYRANQGQVQFFNFYTSVIFFCLIYPQEIETCLQLQFVYQDLMNFHKKQSGPQLSKPKKKVKKGKKDENEEQVEDPKKPFHVLTDIFISLMTKPPIFLRRAIHSLFQLLVPFLDTSDIGNLLAVITTPDAEFIEEI